MKNFVTSLSAGNDSITFEKVKSGHYSRELRLKASENVDEVYASELSIIDSTKG